MLNISYPSCSRSRRRCLTAAGLCLTSLRCRRWSRLPGPRAGTREQHALNVFLPSQPSAIGSLLDQCQRADAYAAGAEIIAHMSVGGGAGLGRTSWVASCRALAPGLAPPNAPLCCAPSASTLRLSTSRCAREDHPAEVAGTLHSVPKDTDSLQKHCCEAALLPAACICPPFVDVCALHQALGLRLMRRVGAGMCCCGRPRRSATARRGAGRPGRPPRVRRGRTRCTRASSATAATSSPSQVRGSLAPCSGHGRGARTLQRSQAVRLPGCERSGQPT